MFLIPRTDAAAVVPLLSILEVVVDSQLRKAESTKELKSVSRPQTASDQRIPLQHSLSTPACCSVPSGGYGGIARPSTANSSSVPSNGYGGISRAVPRHPSPCVLRLSAVQCGEAGHSTGLEQCCNLDR